MNKHGKKSKKPTKKPTLKIILSLTIIMISLAYGLWTLRKYRQGIPTPIQSPARADMKHPAVIFSDSHPSSVGLEDMKPLPQEDSRTIRNVMVERLNLSISQKLELREVWQDAEAMTPQELQARLEQTRDVLDSQQLDTLREVLGQRIPWRVAERLEAGRRVLPKDQYEIYQKRVQERVQEFGQALSALTVEVEGGENARKTK